MKKSIFKYQRKDGPVYLTFDDKGNCIDWRGPLTLSAADVIADLVHQLTAAELSAVVIKNQCKVMGDALAIVNDQRTRIEFRL